MTAPDRCTGIRIASAPFLVRAALAALGAGVFFGLVGPYGSYLNGGAPERILYWSTCSLAGLALYAVPISFARRAGLICYGARFWSGAVAAIACLGLVQTYLTRSLAGIIWPSIAARLPGWPVWYVQVLLIAFPAVILTLLVLRARDRRTAIRPADHGSGEGRAGPLGADRACVAGVPVFHGEMPMAAVARPVALPLPQTVIALQMEDHYIRCHRAHGSELVHGTLRDAIARQSSCEGLQVHRSWWVARRAVTRSSGTPRTMRLHLSNGIVVPVARTQVARLREAGWLDSHDGPQ